MIDKELEFGDEDKELLLKMGLMDLSYAVKCVQELYRYAPTGGWLHIVTDDYNCCDRCLLFCAADLNANWNTTDPEEREATLECLKVLFPLTEDQREWVVKSKRSVIGEK